jgi:hypothetical protein
MAMPDAVKKVVLAYFGELTISEPLWSGGSADRNAELTGTACAKQTC